ncbi:MAG: hypothetical protein ACTSPB_17430 [Candidatus Thorarchaeota archaeon]
MSDFKNHRLRKIREAKRNYINILPESHDWQIESSTKTYDSSDPVKLQASCSKCKQWIHTLNGKWWPIGIGSKIIDCETAYAKIRMDEALK